VGRWRLHTNVISHWHDATAVQEARSLYSWGVWLLNRFQMGKGKLSWREELTSVVFVESTAMRYAAVATVRILAGHGYLDGFFTVLLIIPRWVVGQYPNRKRDHDSFLQYAFKFMFCTNSITYYYLTQHNSLLVLNLLGVSRRWSGLLRTSTAGTETIVLAIINCYYWLTVNYHYSDCHYYTPP
jgi:hypothetical protein